jgi:hypothetical protein
VAAGPKIVVKQSATINQVETRSLNSFDSIDSTMTDLGKVLIAGGLILLVAGAVVVLLGRSGVPLGRLPGDFLYRGKNTTIYFPLATSLLLSVLLSVVLYLIGLWRR